MSGMVQIKSGSESDLQGAIANAGPVSVAVDGSSNYFRVSGFGLHLKLNPQFSSLNTQNVA